MDNSFNMFFELLITNKFLLCSIPTTLFHSFTLDLVITITSTPLKSEIQISPILRTTSCPSSTCTCPPYLFPITKISECQTPVLNLCQPLSTLPLFLSSYWEGGWNSQVKTLGDLPLGDGGQSPEIPPGSLTTGVVPTAQDGDSQAVPEIRREGEVSH